MKTHKKAFCALVCMVIAFLAIDYAVNIAMNGRPHIAKNNRRFTQVVSALNPGQTVPLSALTPFDWDRLYLPAPYESRESIEAALGFSSSDIRDNSINEGMQHMIFASGQRVTACILGHAASLGFCFDFSACNAQLILPGDNVQLRVTGVGDVLTLRALP